MSANHRPTRVVTAKGELRIGVLTDDEQIAVWAHCLHDGAPGRIEVVGGKRAPDGSLRMRSRSAPSHFPAAGDLRALVALAHAHRELGDEVFATPLTRRLARPGKAGQILPARVAWVDIDQSSQLEALRAFAVRPHLVLYSGSGGAHAYWRLAEALAPDEIEAANRKLALHLGADEGATDRARIMRLPGTHNHKAKRACRLAYCDLHRPAVDDERLTAGLRDPSPLAPAPTPAPRARHAARISHDAAATIAPPTYFRVMAGIDVPARGGHVPCPLPDHDEQISSCMVYPNSSQGWHCFGCGRGGSIYDLGSLLEGGSWGRKLCGEQFTAVKQRVHAQLGIDPSPSPPRRARARRRARTDAGQPTAGSSPPHTAIKGGPR